MQTSKLKYLPFFIDMDVDSLTKLAEDSQLKYFSKKESLFVHGDKIKYFYVICSGWTKLFRNTLDGQEAILGLTKSGDLIGETNLDNDTHSFSATTISNSQLLLIPQETLKKSVELYPHLSIRIIKSLTYNLSLLELQLEHASTMNATQRVCCFILRLSDLDQPSFKVALPYDKNIIAAYLGMKSETFSRALNELKSLGVTIKNNTLYVRDIQKLIKFCCISCSLVFDYCKK